MTTKFQAYNELHIDEDAKQVTIPAQLNDNYFSEPGRHLAVNPDGNEGGKTLFDSKVTPLELHEALEEIGAEPGNNLTYETAQDQHVEGTPLQIDIVWEGADQAYSVDDILEDSNGNAFDFRFGGNKETSKEKQTGCLICLDSCYISPVSNATYTFGAIKKRGEVDLPAKQDLLPEDGTSVEIIITIK